MASDTAVAAMCSLLAKILGAIKIYVSARWFGVSAEMDAFVLAFLVPSLLAELLVAPAEAALIPALSRTSDRFDMYSWVMARALRVLMALALMLAVMAALFTASLPAHVGLMLRWLSPIVPLMGVATISRSALYAERRVAQAALIPMMTPLVTLAVLALAGRSWGVRSLVAGAVFGLVAEAALGIWLASRAGYLPRWIRMKSTPAWSSLRDAYLPAVVLALAISGTPAIEQWFAATEGLGAASTFNLGTRLVTVMASVGAAIIGAVASSHLSRFAAAGEWSFLRDVHHRYGRAVWLCTIPVLLLLIGFSEALLRRGFSGSALSGVSLQAVTLTQQISLVQFPLMIMLAFHARTLLTTGATKPLFRAASLLLFMTLCGDYAAVRSAGLPGLCVAGVVNRAVAVALLANAVRQAIKSRRELVA